MVAARAGPLLFLATCSWRICTSALQPPCDFDACEQCLPDAVPRPARVNLTILGPDEQTHESPFRIARSEWSWDAQAVVGHIVGILVAEKLGIHVEYLHLDSQLKGWFAVNNCIGWQDNKCDQYEVAGEAALAQKVFQDVLADVMFMSDLESTSIGPGTFQGTQLRYEDRSSVSLGPLGHTEIASLFAYESIIDAAQADGVDASWLPALARADVTKYFDVPHTLMDAGVVAEFQGCNSSIDAVDAGMASLRAYNWTCKRSWWLNPACATHGDQWTTRCLVLIDDDWAYRKPELFRALTATQAPVAKLAVGYSVWYDLLPQRRYNTTFTWWTEDASLALAMPAFVRMPLGMEPTPGIQMKVGWGPAMQADRRLGHFLDGMHLQQGQMTELISQVGAAYIAGYPQAPATYQKVVCEWLRSNNDVWSQWMPSVSDCVWGEVFDEALQDCVPCPRGKYGKVKGRTSKCLPCPGGTFGALEGSLACTPCAPGRFSSADGASSSDTCERCVQGNFASYLGLTACEACNATFTTAFLGAADPGDCTCPAGTYLRRDSAAGGRQEVHCAACVLGLQCVGGNLAPLQAAGYSVGAFTSGGPTVIVTCFDETKCPGGTALGTCPEFRQGVACDLCMPGTFERSGRCTPCEGWRSSSPLFVAIAVFLVVVAALVARGAYGQAHVNPASAVTVLLTVGIIVNSLQVLSSFQKLAQNWPEPLASMENTLRIFSFDIAVLRPSCALGIVNPSSSYLISLLVHPCFVVVSSLSMVAVRPCGYRVFFDDVLNAQGMVVLAVYITLAVIALLPWQCTQNPDGTSSMTTRRSVLCWTTPEHRMMLLFSILALAIYVLGAFTVAIWATWQYPTKIHSVHGARFLRRFQFLFSRFIAQRYNYAVAFMLRNLLVSVVPVIFVNERPAAILLLVLVIGTSCAAQCRFYPWRETTINHIDALTSLAVLLALVGGALLLARDESQTVRTVQYFYFVLFSGVSAILAAVLAQSLWRWRFPRRPFGCFLCHHKEGAAVLARWLKILLKDRTPEGVFLDSDELDNLDKLFEVVAYQTKYLVVLLTAETMRRIWCAGEMATAVRYKVAIVPVACDGFQPPTDEYIAGIDANWTDVQKNQVLAQGVTMENIKHGLHVVRALPMLKLERTLPQAAQELVVDRIFASCPQLRATSTGMLRRRSGIRGPQALGVADRSGSSANIRQAEVIIAGHWKDPEAACICAVLQRLLQAALVVPVEVVGAGDASLQQYVSARYLVATMTRGVLENAHFGVVLAESYATGHIHATPVVADVSFHVPGEDFWERLRSGEVEFDTKVLVRSGVSVQDITRAYQSLFRVLAVRFSAHGSSRIQSAEIQELAPRLRRRLAGAATGSFGVPANVGPVSSPGTEAEAGATAAMCPEESASQWVVDDLLDSTTESCAV